jgi:integrase
MHPRAQAAMRVILYYGMRASEYLNVTKQDILPYDRVVVRGLKGSASYIIILPGICEQVSNCDSFFSLDSVSNITYNKLYQSCVRAGLRDRLDGRKNWSVTHLGRYKLVRETLDKFDFSIKGDVLHHRNPNTIKYYLNKKGGNDG